MAIAKIRRISGLRWHWCYPILLLSAFAASSEGLGAESIRGPAPGNARPYGVACQSGSFQIIELGSGTELDPDAIPYAGLEIELLGDQIAILDRCEPVPAHAKLTTQGTELSARWPRCEGFPQGVRLQGTIEPTTCSQLSGLIQAPGLAPSIRFGAQQRLLSQDTTGGDPDGGSGRGVSRSSNKGTHKGFQRWYANFVQRATPVGLIPPGALDKGLKQIAENAVPAPVEFFRWESLGPAPMRDKPDDPNESPATIRAGRVDALAVDPADADHWLIGAATGGIWETPDSGDTWFPRTDDQPSLATSAITFAPSYPDYPSYPKTVFAGTGNYNPQGTSVYPGVGMLKSTDGGTTWTHIGADVFSGLGFGGIAVHPKFPGTLVAATLEAVPGAFYEAYLPPGAGTPGVYRSATDGASWELKLAGQATAVVSHPTNPFFFLYAGIQKPASTSSSGRMLPTDATGGIFRSLNGGQNWSRIHGPWESKRGGVGEVRLAVSPSDPDVLYASIRDAMDSRGKDGYLLGVWKTQNAWDPSPSWVELGPAPLIANFGTHALLVHGSDPDVVYLASGAVPLWKWLEGEWLSISTANPDGSPPLRIHVDHRSLAWVGPTNLLVGNDGGVYMKNEVQGGPWSERNHGLAITQFWGGGVHPDEPEGVIGGAQDSGAVLMVPPAGPVWKEVTSGDGMGGFFGDDLGHLALPMQYGILARSLDGGDTFDGQTTDNIPPGEQAFNWTTPAVRCPFDPNRVLYGGFRVWKSENFFSEDDAKKIEWDPMSPDIQTTPVRFVTALAFAPSDDSCETYAYANNLGQIFLTTDDGDNWQQLNPGTELPPRIATALAFAPENADTLWVTFSGYDAATPTQPGHVFRITNATSVSPTTAPIWVNLSPPVDLPFNAVAVHPTNSDVVYVGCDVGAWSTGDGGQHWVHHGPKVGMPNVPVTDLHVGACRTTAFTFGRSAFRTTEGLVPCFE